MKGIIPIDLLKGTFIVPFTLAIVLIPTSLLIGWNFLTLILFWFVVIPCLAIYLPKKFSKRKNHLPESLTGVIMFYGLMVFLIYDYSKTDYFKVMLISCLINLVLIVFASFVRKPARYIT